MHDNHLLLGQAPLNLSKCHLHLALFLFDLYQLTFNQIPRRTFLLTKVTNQALLLFLKGAKSPLQGLAVSQWICREVSLVGHLGYDLSL
jgi:hypothetical protein